MTDRETALRELLEKVEAGHAVAKDFEKVWGTACQDMAMQEIHRNAFYAFKGSLDAAKALHEAVLPGWTRSVDATAPECLIDVDLHRKGRMRSVRGQGEDEARAWLIAIIKALIAQEGE